MSLTLTSTLHCDWCGATLSETTDLNAPPSVSRSIAKTFGWSTFMDGTHLKDLCGICIDAEDDASWATFWEGHDRQV